MVAEVEGVKYEELVEIELPNGTIKLGKVFPASGDGDADTADVDTGDSVFHTEGIDTVNRT